MKLISFIFAAFIAVGAALPPQVGDFDHEPQQARLVSDAVTEVIEDLAETIRARGLDPFNMEKFDVEYSPLPVKNLLELNAIIEKFLVVGASDIIINRMSFSIFTRRLTFDVSIPDITLSLGNGQFNGVVFNEKLSAKGAGKVTIKNIGLEGRAGVSVIGAVVGSAVNSLDINFYLGSIDSQIETLNILGIDLASDMNDFINTQVFGAIINSKNDISDLVEIIAWDVINKA